MTRWPKQKQYSPKEEWTFHADCQIVCDLISPKSNRDTKFSIENQRDEILFVYWIGYDGSLEPYIRLNAGELRECYTSVGHSWMVTTEELRMVLAFTSGAKMERIVVTPEHCFLEPDGWYENAAMPVSNGFDWLPSEWRFSTKVDNSARSISGLCSTSFRFENKLAEGVNLIWIDYYGKQTFHCEVDPGEEFEQITFATQPWLVQDKLGNNLLFFVAGTNQLQLVRVA
jgi:hypothetical protein